MSAYFSFAPIASIYLGYQNLPKVAIRSVRQAYVRVESGHCGRSALAGISWNLLALVLGEHPNNACGLIAPLIATPLRSGPNVIGGNDMFEGLPTDDLVRIAAAGGGFELSAGERPTVDLVRIATAARNKGARLKISGLGKMSINDLIRIAAAGGGCVELLE